MARFTRLASIFALCIVLVNCPSTPKPPGQTVAAPAFSPAEGVFPAAQSVTLSTSTEGAQIRYTTDGSAPTATTGTVYSGPIQVSSTTTIRAMAAKTGWADSPVVSATFTIGGKVADVQFDPPAGTFDTAPTVALRSATDGAQIYYTTDGSAPRAGSGILYAGPITVTATQTIQAIALKQSMTDSAVTSGQYTINASRTMTSNVPPITDVEVDDARNALARAREVDADFFDPDNYDSARQLLEEGVSLRVSDPATARQKLSDSKEKADLSFTNSVQRSAQVMAANLEAARKRLLALEADKFLADDYQKAISGIDEAAAL